MGDDGHLDGVCALVPDEAAEAGPTVGPGPELGAAPHETISRVLDFYEGTCAHDTLRGSCWCLFCFSTTGDTKFMGGMHGVGRLSLATRGQENSGDFFFERLSFC